MRQPAGLVRYWWLERLFLVGAALASSVIGDALQGMEEHMVAIVSVYVVSDPTPCMDVWWLKFVNGSIDKAHQLVS